MKYLLYILFFLTFAATAQEPANPLGSTKTAIKVLGRFYVDSAFYLPNRKAIWTPLRPGALTFDNDSSQFKGWYGDHWGSLGGGSGGGSDELDTIVSLNGTRTSIRLPHGLGYTPATATVSINDSSYGIPEAILDSNYIYLQYAAAPVGTFTYKVSFHRRAGVTGSTGGGGGDIAPGGNNYTSNVTFAYPNLTTSRSGLNAIITNLTHAHPQSDIIGLSDSIASKRLVNAAFTGTTTKTLTLTLANATTISASFADLDSGSGGGGGAVSTVFARSGDITAQNGDYTGVKITNAPAGNISATSVQSAIDELDNEKVIKNTAITAATNTKITYDAKGLITSGTALIAGDIPNLDASKITTGVFPLARLGSGTALQVFRINAAGTATEWATATGGGTVSTVSTGSLSPLFTSSIATATTTPAISFALSNAAANTIFGNSTNASAAPTYFTPSLSGTLFKNQGATTTVLHGNAAGNPSWGAINLATDITGVLPSANGGVGPLSINTQTVNYTLVLSDANSKLLRLNKATAFALIIPTNASVSFPVGTQVTYYQEGAGQITVSGAAGVTVNSANGFKTRARYSTVTAIQTTNNNWLITGDITP